MRILNLTKYILAVLSLIYIFINWKIAVWLFLSASTLHAALLGPNVLLNSITGFLAIGGVIYIFIDWKISILLVMGSGLVAKFHVWSNKKNADYYKNHETNS